MNMNKTETYTPDQIKALTNRSNSDRMFDDLKRAGFTAVK